MTENDLFNAFRCCITKPCRGCPMDDCEGVTSQMVQIPIRLALDVNSLLAGLLNERDNLKQEVANLKEYVANHSNQYWG